MLGVSNLSGGALQQNLPNRIEVLNDRVLTFSGTLTPRDYQMALYLHHRPRRLVEMAQPLGVVGYLSAIALYGVGFLSALSLTVLTFPLFVLLIWRIMFFEEQVRLAFLRDPSLGYRYDFTVTAEMLLIASPVDEFRLDWSTLSHYKQNHCLTLLYRSETEFFLFPHHWFQSTGDLAWFQTQLRSTLGDPRR